MHDTALLLLPGNGRGEISWRLEAVRTTSKCLFVYFAEEKGLEASTSLLTTIAHIYDIVAVEKPCLNVVPLLPFAGWTSEKVSELTSVQAIFTSDDTSKVLEGLRAYSTFQQITLYHISKPSSSGAEEHPNQDEGSEVQAIPHNSSLSFSKVGVGGTFDRLHAGHRSLLAATALVATDYIFAGITGDQLLVNKKHKDLLEPYERRKDAAVSFMQSVRPSLQVAAGPLLDPKARTMAAYDASMQALVVSQETLAGGQAINDDRRSQGFKDLVLVIVNLVGCESKALDGQKLSSTALREKEASSLLPA